MNCVNKRLLGARATTTIITIIYLLNLSSVIYITTSFLLSVPFAVRLPLTRHERARDSCCFAASFLAFGLPGFISATNSHTRKPLMDATCLHPSLYFEQPKERLPLVLLSYRCHCLHLASLFFLLQAHTIDQWNRLRAHDD